MRIGKATSSSTTKLVFLCVALLGTFLLVDLLWASSSSSSSSSFNWPLPASNVLFFPNQTVTNSNKKGDARILSATFADLPAPQLNWEKMATSPVPRLDGAALQINDLLFVFAGYGTIDHVRYSFLHPFLFSFSFSYLNALWFFSFSFSSGSLSCRCLQFHRQLMGRNI